MNRARLLALTAVVSLVGCRSTELPNPPPPPGEGSVQGTVVYAKPGLSALVPAKGATIELLGTSIVATSSESGYFALTPIPVKTGAVLFRFDADGDGAIDHQKLIRLEDLLAGPGKDIALGQVTLGGNALVKGAVLRADQLTAGNGHGGTTVFVPEGPFLAYAGDNGSFTFENLPEGDLTLSFFRAGYEAQQASVSLRAGEVFTLSTIVLTADTSSPPKTKVTGLVSLFGAAASDGVTVHAGAAATTTTDAEGNYTFAALDPGVYVFGFEKSGYTSVTLRNVVVTSANTQVAQVTMTQGTSLPTNRDAGEPYDAGTGSATDGGGVTDAGFVDAGIVDAGPRAIIDPPAAFVAKNTSFTLNGSNSIGVRPLSYRWQQTAGPTVTIPNNDSVIAASPTIVAPNTETVLKFTLRITDATGAVSPVSAEVMMPVGGAPTAVILAGWPTTVFASQQVQFDGHLSSDPSGIIQYNWSVSPLDAGIAIQPAGTAGELALLTMPASVPTALLVTVRLEVISGLLVPSAMPATATFTLTTASAPTWSLDAGLPQAVPGGSPVTLTGSTVTPGVPGATFSYLWSPAREPATGTAEWQLTDATASTTTFIAPHVVGDPRLINFTLTATSTSGLMPAQRSVNTWVSVIDRSKPSVLSTSIIEGRGSTRGMIIEFDEPIAPGSVNSISVNAATGSPFPAPSIAERIVEGSRLTLTYAGTGAVSGSSQVLNVSGVTDRAPSQPNAMGSVVFPFLADPRWSPPFESQSSSPTDPRPGLTVITDGGVPTVYVFGRKGNRTWFLQPFNPSDCASTPCPLNDDTSAPSVELGATTYVRGPRGTSLASVSYALAQMKDQLGDAGMAFRNDGSGWSALAEPPGTLFSDGANVSSLYAENNSLKIVRLVSSTWSYVDAGLITNDPSNFSTDAFSDPVPVGVGALTNATVVSALTSKNGDIRAFINPRNTTTWLAYGSLGTNSGDRVLDTRTSITSNYPNSGYTATLHASGKLHVVVYGDVNNATDFFTSGATSFDTIYNNNAMWVVASVNGKLQLKVIPFGTFTPVAVAGPPPSGYLNNDSTCFADQPEMKFVNEKLFVVWAERCNTDPWKIYFRALY